MTDAIPFIYIKVPCNIASHPLIAPLRDKAFRLLIEAWGWCREWLTDGIIPIGIWRKMHTKRAREELLECGLAQFTETGDIEMTDYAGAQQSREESAKARAQAARDGAYGGHVRHHARRGISVPESCAWCAEAVRRPAPPPDPDPDPGSPPNSPPTPETLGPLPDPDGVAVAESESETEGETGVDRRLHLQVVDAPRPDDDDRLHGRIEGEVRAVLGALTGAAVSPEHAARIRATLLAGERKRNPMAYVLESVKREPASWLPDSPRWARRPAASPEQGTLPPAYSTRVAEALARANPDRVPPTVGAVAPAG